MDIQEKFRSYLIGWFILLTAVVILSSAVLILVSIFYHTSPALPQPPTVPRAISYPSFKDTLTKKVALPRKIGVSRKDTLVKEVIVSKELITARADIFKKQVDDQTTIYEKQIDLYKAELIAWKQVEENRPKTDPYSIYSLIIKDTLAPLITALLTAIVTYVFVVKGTDAVEKYVNERQAARFDRQARRE